MADKVKKPIWKKWWFWGVLVVLVLVVGVANSGKDTTSKQTTDTAAK
ncbi:MAG: hypothetical protein LBT80_07485 [Lactobacillaceae bacterium]|jgi:hypothetical protein|nr:hypothetical protein [Lactobacillaceae bacterium]